MEEQPALTPFRERTLNFRGKELRTADLNDNQGYVSFNSLCEAFGLDRRGQRQRLSRQESFYRPYTTTIVMATPGGPQPTLCLMAAAVPLFLTGVQLERVRDPQARDLLEAFLDEAMEVLAEHFGLSERGELRFLRESVARMVVEQEVFEEARQEQRETDQKKVEAELAQLREEHEQKVQQIREAFAQLRSYIDRVAGPKERISPEQLGQLRETVSALGTLLQERGVAKPFPGIYMDITKITGVSRSEHITQKDFPQVLEFLDAQIQALLKKGAPETYPPEQEEDRGIF